MRPLVGFRAALGIDSSVKDDYLLSDDTLMESAAAGMAAAILSDPAMVAAMNGRGIQVAALCGRGNNGGDALAVLRRLAFAGLTGLVAIVEGDMRGTAGRRLAEAARAGVSVLAPGDSAAKAAVEGAAVLLDGISGIGYQGPRREGFSSLASLVDSSKDNAESSTYGIVVAIDVPSGSGPFYSVEADPEPPIRARTTLCVEPLKAELFYPGFRPYAGEIRPIVGVFPPSAGHDSGCRLLEASDMPGLLPVLDPDCHKGGRGSLALFAGSRGSVGAATLCARAGSAAGAGSVTLFARDEIVDIAASALSTQMVRPMSDPGTRRFDAVVAGPGWGMDATSGAMLERLWEAALPLVLDADALRLLAESPRPPRCSPLVLTPHPGEFAGLAAVASGYDHNDTRALEIAARRARYDTAAVLRETAERFSAIVVLKGSVTWIGAPDGRLAVWDGREPGLATAGSGDVLAGIIGGILARIIGATGGLPPVECVWRAAMTAVIIHGLAGTMAVSHGFFEADALLGPVAELAFGRGR